MTKNLKMVSAVVLGIIALISIGFAIQANNQAEQTLQTNEELASQLQSMDSELSETSEALEESRESLSETNEQLEASRAEQQTLQDELSAIKQELQESQSEEENETAETSATREGEVIDDLFLGDAVSFTLDDGDLEQFLDGEIRFNDDDYDIHEEFVALSGDSYILYSSADDEELGSSPAYGLTEDGALEYRYVFDDAVNMSEVSDDESLEIRLLGEEFEIVSVTADEIQFRTGDEAVLREGETVQLAGYEVSLEVLSDSGAYICVDGQCAAVEEYDTELIGDVDVRLEDAISNDNGGIATIIVGADTIIDQDSGDEFLEIEDSPFVLEIVSNGDMLESIVIAYDEQRTDVDDDFAPLFVGESIAFPYDYVTVLFDSVLHTDYVEFNFEFDGFSEDVESVGDVDNDECGVISTDEDGAIEVLTEDVEEVFVCQNGTAYYQDTTGDWYEANVTDVTLVNDDTEVSLAIGGLDRLQFNNSNDSQIRLDTVWNEERLGAEDDEAESGDILLGTTEIGEKEYDVLTSYGVIISVPEDSADADEFSLSLPSERLEVELLVY